MTALFYTATCFLDVSLDVINVLKSGVDLHVLIEIHPGVKKFNIIDVEQLPHGKVLVHPADLLTPEQYTHFKPYFDGLKSVHFVVHSRKSVSTFFRAALEITRFTRRIKPDVLHLEAMLLRSVSLLPSVLFSRKLVVSIHDPLPHSGEKNRAEGWLRSLYLKLPVAKSYLFYSQFAKGQFEKHFIKAKSPKGVIQMKPYTYFNRLASAERPEGKHILFFGRLSRYKGIDVLMQAMPDVFAEFPGETLVIAGRSMAGFEMTQEVVQAYGSNIRLLNRYISNDELVQLILDAKFIVCPYLDATQSGVLMTAFALNTPVIATNVGAFPEYIKEGETGLLTTVGNPVQLAQTIKKALQGDAYKRMKNRIVAMNSRNQWFDNKEVLLASYA